MLIKAAERKNPCGEMVFGVSFERVGEMSKLTRPSAHLIPSPPYKTPYRWRYGLGLTL